MLDKTEDIIAYTSEGDEVRGENVFSYLKNITLREKLLWLFFVLIPVMRVPSLPLVKQKIQYSELVFILLFVGWMVRYLKGKVNLQKVPAGFALFAMLSIFLLSFINSQNRLISSIDFLGIFCICRLVISLNWLVNGFDLPFKASFC